MCSSDLFETVAHFQSLAPRQGVTAIGWGPASAGIYTASPTPGWWAPNDIPAHITPTKSAGAPDVPNILPSYWDSESSAYCSVGGSVSGECALPTTAA